MKWWGQDQPVQVHLVAAEQDWVESDFSVPPVPVVTVEYFGVLSE
jgi:hypothetical protein